MNKEEMIKYYAKEIEDCERFGAEEGHIYADDLLCELLRRLGFEEVVEKFENLKKWYS